MPALTLDMPALTLDMPALTLHMPAPTNLNKPNKATDNEPKPT
jgi:hypothetical protein